MHDLFLAQKILDEVLFFAQKNKLRNVTKIAIELGKFKEHNEEISSSNLKFNLSSLSRGTIAAGAKIEVKKFSKQGYLRIKGIKGEK